MGIRLPLGIWDLTFQKEFLKPIGNCPCVWPTRGWSLRQQVLQWTFHKRATTGNTTKHESKYCYRTSAGRGYTVDSCREKCKTTKWCVAFALEKNDAHGRHCVLCNAEKYSDLASHSGYDVYNRVSLEGIFRVVLQTLLEFLAVTPLFRTFRHFWTFLDSFGRGNNFLGAKKANQKTNQKRNFFCWALFWGISRSVLPYKSSLQFYYPHPPIN